MDRQQQGGPGWLPERRYRRAFLAAAGILLSIDPAIARVFEIEAGSRVSADTFQSLDQTFVAFDQPFDVPPVVVALPDQAGSNSAALRITNVSTLGFFAVVTETEGWDGEHVAVNFDYIAVTPGTHRLPSGHVIAAGRVDTTAVQHGTGVTGPEAWQTVTFDDMIGTSTVVLADPQSARNESNPIPDAPAAPFMTAAIEGASPGSVRLAIERSQSRLGTVTQAETLGWIAFPSGENASFQDVLGQTVNWSSRYAPNAVRGWSDGCFNVTHGLNTTSAVVIAKKNSRNEDDGGWFRSCGQNATQIRLRVDEDRGVDGERNHGPEDAGVVAFDRAFHARFELQMLDGIVFRDDGTGGATPYDAVQGTGEESLSGVAVSLLNAANNVLATTQTSADGAFTLDIPDTAIAQPLRLVVEPPGTLVSVSEEAGTLSNVVNPSSVDGEIQFSPLRYDNYTGIFFGEVDGPTLVGERQVTTAPGQKAIIAQTYRANSAGDVTFTIGNSVANPAGLFDSEIYHDVDCSGSLSSAEGIFPGPLPVVAGDEVCVIVVTNVATGATTGSQLTYDLIAQTQLTGLSQAFDLSQENIVLVDTSSYLVLTKEVCNLTAGTCDAATGVGFGVTNSGSPGDALRYRLIFTVSGRDDVRNISLFDTVPGFSTLVPASPTVVTAPGGVTCQLETPTGGGTPGYDGALEWSCTGADIASGGQGIVSFDVQIEQ